MTGQPFLEKRIYYHDTDTGGVVYYASYLKHLEEARTEYFRGIGIEIAEYARNGTIFPVVHLEIDYKSPARYGDIIRIYTKPEKIGNASLEFSQQIMRGETLILKARTVWACVKVRVEGPNADADKGGMRPSRIPEEIRAKIAV